MGWLKKQTSPDVDSLLSMADGEIDKLLKQHKGTPFKSAKQLRKASADGRRPLEGEKGMGALLAGLQGGGTGNKNHQNIPKAQRQHPSITRRDREQLLKDVASARARGDRAAEVRLKQQAKRDGLI